MKLREIWKEDTILDAGGNQSARRKPARARMDREPNSHTTLARLGIEPGPHWWKAREQPLRQPARPKIYSACHLHERSYSLHKSSFLPIRGGGSFVHWMCLLNVKSLTFALFLSTFTIHQYSNFIQKKHPILLNLGAFYDSFLKFG